MVLEGRHVAVTAGLVACGVVAVPSVAMAESAARLSRLFSDVPLVPFLVGLAGGFACVGVAVLAVERSRRGRGAHNADAVRRRQEAQGEPAQSGRRTGQSQPERSRRAGGAHFATDAWDKNGELRIATAVAESSVAPRHLRAQQETPRSAAAELASVPDVEGYEGVAERYVAAEAKQNRMLARARGVASVLMERMERSQGVSEQTGVPMIQRGPSTLTDADAWWDDVEPVTSVPLAVSAQPAESADSFAESDLELRREAAKRVAERRKGAERIARGVARVEQDAYPEKRTVDDLAGFDDDLWLQSMRAMDEHVAAQADFVDSVGDGDTIDEPDGIEQATRVISFRVPAGHSEVTDTASYVAYLLDDELSRNSSQAVRDRSRSYLRVLEGGTAPTARVAGRGARKEETARATGKHYATPDAPKGRHFARAAEA